MEKQAFQKVKMNKSLPVNKSLLESFLSESTSPSTTSSKKRKALRDSSSEDEMEPETASYSSDQELSENSTSNTLAEILQLVQRQSVEIAMLKEQLGKLPASVSLVEQVKKKFLGLCKKGDMKGRLFSCFKDENNNVVKGSYEWFKPEVQLSDVAKKVSGKKTLADGKTKKWSSWKDLESEEFVMGTYSEKIV